MQKISLKSDLERVNGRCLLHTEALNVPDGAVALANARFPKVSSLHFGLLKIYRSSERRGHNKIYCDDNVVRYCMVYAYSGPSCLEEFCNWSCAPLEVRAILLTRDRYGRTCIFEIQSWMHCSDNAVVNRCGIVRYIKLFENPTKILWSWYQ